MLLNLHEIAGGLIGHITLVNHDFGSQSDVGAYLTSRFLTARVYSPVL